MVRILVRPVPFVVITLSLFLLTGCSGLFGDPREQANIYLAEANEAIDQHNQLFEAARTTYAAAKEAVEAGEDPSREARNIAQTRETMQEAQEQLLEARESLIELQDLDVELEIREYAGLLRQALDAQTAAEDREVDFYRILEEDPLLERNRETALDILDEVDDGYQRAENAYGRAREIADANPELIRES